MAVVQNIFPHMLTMLRVAMITTRKPQEEVILSRLCARKLQASEHSIPVPLDCGTKRNHLLRDKRSKKRFLRDLQRK